MANTRIIAMQVKQIIRLHENGESRRKISTMLGIHRRTVKEYLRLYELSGKDKSILLMSETDIQKSLGIKRKEKPKDKRYEAAKMFLSSQEKNKRKPGFTVENMYKDYTVLYETNCYSLAHFYKIVRLEWNKEQGSVRLNHEYGDKLFIDYTGKKLSYIDRETGELHEVEVLVSILPASQYIYVEAMPSQKSVDFITGVINALKYIDGVPKGIISDNLKSAVTNAGKYQSIINKSFQDMALHYKTTIDPTRPYHPKDKALVEGAVKIAYNAIFYEVSKHTHFSISQLNETIAKELTKLNNRKLSNSDNSRNDQYQEEKKYLSALPRYRYEKKEYRKAKVQKMGYVFCSPYKNYYSVPYRFIGKQVELRFDKRTFEVYYKSERIARHPLHQGKGRYSTISSHLSSNNQAIIEWSPTYFSKKAEVQGPYIQQYIDNLIEQKPYPEQAYKQAQGILALHKQYGLDRVEKACEIALDCPKYSYKMIKTILENNQDKIQQGTIITDANPIPTHENLRGSNYYK